MQTSLSHLLLFSGQGLQSFVSEASDVRIIFQFKGIPPLAMLSYQTDDHIGRL